MDSLTLAILIPVLILSVALGLWISWRRIRPILTDPDMKAARKIGYFERFRAAKWARSEQPIGDPEKARKAEVVARSTVKSLHLMTSPRHWVLGAVLLLLLLAVGEWDPWRIWWEVGALAMLAVIYLWSRRTRGQIERTADINGWDLEGASKGTDEGG